MARYIVTALLAVAAASVLALGEEPVDTGASFCFFMAGALA